MVNYRTGDLCMLWRARVNKQREGWTGPLRVLLQESTTLWLATGTAKSSETVVGQREAGHLDPGTHCVPTGGRPGHSPSRILSPAQAVVQPKSSGRFVDRD